MVSNTNNFSGPYNTDGVTTIFPVTFEFLNNADLQVLLFTISTGLYTTLALNGDYTVTGAGVSQGGSITTTQTYAAATYYIVILRNMTLVQSTSIANQSAFLPDVVEGQFDINTLQLQQLQEQINRCYKVPPGSAAPGFIAPSGGGGGGGSGVLPITHPTLANTGIYPVSNGIQIQVAGVIVGTFTSGGFVAG